MKQAPIGIFDSGIGGMTVARAINHVLPGESLVYFGDTAHLPYGDKSAESIRNYSTAITQFLLDKGCKVIVIACNSASSAAYSEVKELASGKALVLNVIDPVVEFIDHNCSDSRIGLIGTKQTVSSGVYEQKINKLSRGIELKSLATPLLAHLIEEGFCDNKISKEVINEYLSSDELDQIDSLILGCTHYPLIRDEINEYYRSTVQILDSASIVANKLHHLLTKHSLVNDGKEMVPDNHFFVSDFTKSFEESTKIFFGEKIKLEFFPLWEGGSTSQ